MKSLLNAIVNFGVKKDYLPWEIAITRKFNQISLVSFINVVVLSVCLFIWDIHDYVGISLLVLALTPLIFVVSKIKNYIWAAYTFYIIGFILLNTLSIKMGPDSYAILNYFPVIISALQILGRKELLKHMVIIFSLCVLSVIAVLFYYYKIDYSKFALDNSVKTINILFSVSSTLIFMIISAIETVKQEQLIDKIVKEKEVLLAEVYHRVKNNMNIITSILNLKKHMSDSIEVQEAMEECRNRVFSMALVHTRLYQSKNLSEINLKDYAAQLINELAFSMGGKNKNNLEFEGEDVHIDVTKAIPCGLILNEVITNSFKYAAVPNKELEIKVKLKHKEDKIFLTIEDNGPGMNLGENKETLGMLLIDSLSEQLNAAHTFENNNGLHFRICFSKS